MRFQKQIYSTFESVDLSTRNQDLSLQAQSYARGRWRESNFFERCPSTEHRFHREA
jgi:hypothetical protein